MAGFAAMDIAASGSSAHRLMLDVVADNIANSGTVRPADEDPFRQQSVLVEGVGRHHHRTFSVEDAGVRNVRIEQADGEPAQVHDPDHPFADADGNVTQPLVDVSRQMADLMVAQRGYQANLRVIAEAREAYESALQLAPR